MKEKILKTFRELGFIMEDLNDLGYGFKYEGTHFLWALSADDDSFLCIAIPSACQMKGDELSFYKKVDAFNSKYKYLKANEFNNNVWLSYERELMGGEEDLETVISHMIVHLDRGKRFFREWDKLNLDIPEEDLATDDEMDECEELTEDKKEAV